MKNERNERSVGATRSSRSTGVLRRFRRFRWGRVTVEAYRQAPAGDVWAAVSRQVLVAGSRGAATAFDVRYFEIAAGGSSACEHHRHAHVVIVLRGEGRIRIGQRWHRLTYLDTC